MTFNGDRSAPTSLMNELNMTDAEIMTTAYLEAVYFTETGDADQPPPDSKLTPFFRCQAFIDCRNFLWAIQDLLKNSDLSPRQLGHDLWLTRNGHGSGFWCRTEVYGEDNAKLFTRLACAVGEHHVDFQENDEAPQHSDSIKNLETS